MILAVASHLRRVGVLSALLFCSACSFFNQSPDHFGSRPITFAELSGWDEEDHLAALAVFNASCPVLARSPKPKTSGSGIKISSSVWKPLCEKGQKAADSKNPTIARQFFETNFVPFRINNNNKETGLFTGYYEPMLYGSRHKHGDYIYPIYAAPANMTKPYYTHAQINKGILKNRGLEIAWVDDPVMRFFMQIQGSGRVRLDDGAVLHLGYADQNGYEYSSLGKVMGDENLIPKDKINFFTIRQYLYDHPKQAFALMERNPSYVFFKVVQRTGAVGAVGVELTPRRSMAVDSKYIPYGLPLFLETDLPAMANSAEPTRFHRIMVVQDTGGAIRGPVRGDIFFGPGEAAEYLAGYMKGHGTYNLLVPNEAAYQLR